MGKYIFGGIAVLGFVLLVALSPFAIVGAGQRGVIIEFGKTSDRVLPEGFHFVNPLADVKTVNVRNVRFDATAAAASKDLQTVTSIIALNYELVPEKVNKLYQEIGMDYEKRVVAPAIQEATKAATAKYTAEELIIKREEVKETITQSLQGRLENYYITVVDVSIVNFEFSAGFNQAIEAKQTAKQEALKAEAELQKVKAEAEQRLAQAQAEAEAIRLQSNAASNNNYVQLKALEVQELAIKKWNGELPQQFIPDATLPFLNLAK